MIYEYKCDECDDVFEAFRAVRERKFPIKCDCGGDGEIQVSRHTSWYFHRTHPDVKQDMHEMVAGVPPANFSEI